MLNLYWYCRVMCLTFDVMCHNRSGLQQQQQTNNLLTSCPGFLVVWSTSNFDECQTNSEEACHIKLVYPAYSQCELLWMYACLRRLNSIKCLAFPLKLLTNNRIISCNLGTESFRQRLARVSSVKMKLIKTKILAMMMMMTLSMLANDATTKGVNVAITIIITYTIPIIIIIALNAV